MPGYQLPIKVFDFFSGCGGTCQGFLNAGMEIIFALDNDPDASETFKSNFPRAEFSTADITSVPTNYLDTLVESCKNHPILFSASAPCQPFTKQKTMRRPRDSRALLLGEFQRFVEHYIPELVFMENVPGLQKVNSEKGPFAEFLATLTRLKYKKTIAIVRATDYGVPQRRRRLVVIASRIGTIKIPQATYGPDSPSADYSTVRQWIGDLPKIAAGETYSSDPIHRAAALSPLNLKRIKAIPPGGNRLQWPSELKLECHSNGYKGHTDVYGRMQWDAPATGLTTRCISLSNGRFGHPEQDRAISVREAACLQTFPMDFVFHGNLNSMSRQIGNAVPVLLAERFGNNFNNHVTRYIKEKKNG